MLADPTAHEVRSMIDRSTQLQSVGHRRSAIEPEAGRMQQCPRFTATFPLQSIKLCAKWTLPDDYNAHFSELRWKPHRSGSLASSCCRDNIPPWTVARTYAYRASHAAPSAGLTPLRLACTMRLINYKLLETWLMLHVPQQQISYNTPLSQLSYPSFRRT